MMKPAIVKTTLILSALVSAAGAADFAHAAPATGKEAAYQYMDYQLAPKASVGRKGKASKKKKKAKLDTAEALVNQAKTELVVPETEKSAKVLETPATVTLKAEPVKSPITYTSFQVGLSVQGYQPSGTGKVEGLEPFELSNLGTRPMVALDFRWMPLELAEATYVNFGGFVSVGYAQHPMDLKTPMGTTFENTRLQSMKAQAGLAASAHLPSSPRWSATALLGGGRMQAIQASSSALANRSMGVEFASLASLAEFRWLDRWSVMGGYEYRQPLRSNTELNLQRHNFLVGIVGSFR